MTPDSRARPAPATPATPAVQASVADDAPHPLAGLPRARAGAALLVLAGGVALAVSLAGRGSAGGPDAGGLDRATRSVSGRITPAPPAATPALPPAAPVSRRVLGALRENKLIARARSVAGDVVAAAVRHSVDPLLLHAIILVESGYRSEAVSSAGARGLMQLMPDTGAQLGVRTEEHLHQSATNVEAGAKYLSWLHTRFEGKLPLVVAAYNAGPGAVQRHGGRVPPYPETRAYVDDVLWLYDELRQARDRRTHG